jgi:hypothetical protein
MGEEGIMVYLYKHNFKKGGTEKEGIGTLYRIRWGKVVYRIRRDRG